MRRAASVLALGLMTLAGCTRDGAAPPTERRTARPTPADTARRTAEAAPPTDAPPVYTVPEVRARRPAPRRVPADTPATAPPLPERPRPAPTPAEPAPTPPEAEDDAPEASAEVRGFVRRYFALQAANDVDALLGLYDRRVRYYDRGEVGRRAVGEDKNRYFRRWPERALRLAGPIRVEAGGAGPRVRVAYTFRVRGEEREREGTAWVELDLVRTPDGYRIAGERGGAGGDD